MPQVRIGRAACAALVIAAASISAQAQDAPPLDGPALSADSAEPETGETFVYATPADLANAPKSKANADVTAPVDDATLDAALADALSADRSELLSSSIKARALRVPQAAYVKTDLNWNKTSNPDGSASYRVDKPLAAWDAKLGADVDVAPPAPTNFRALVTASSSVPAQGASRAWANVTVPDFATVEVQAQPLPDRDSVGTRLQRSIPVGKSLSLTVQGKLGFTEQYAGAPAAPTMPTTPATSSGRNTSIFDSDRSLQLDIHATGTTLLAGSTTTTDDPIVHNRFSAAQKVYGPLTVTGTVNDVGQPTVNKSLTAGFKFDW